MELFASRQRWKHVQRIFADVVGLDPAQRQARLERLCGEDRALHDAVESLLDRHERGAPISEDDLDDEDAWVQEFLSAPESDPAKPRPGGAEDWEGQQVGRYRLLSELGRGAMGVVYRAEDTRLGRPVALKFLSPGLSTDERARARLEREARAASALDHPNICTLYEIGETKDGQLYLALACYDGETLERRIERGPLDVDEAVHIAVAVARGLAAAHRHGIVHRDVKPSNILVTTDGTVKLLDFGIARVADSSLTDSGDVLGTVAYMSPEQLRGEVDARADVWALGVVLHEMLTGHRPFGGDYEAAVLYAVLHEDPPPLDRADVPKEVTAIVCRCLEKDQEDRYQTAEDVEVELERLGLGAASAPVRRIPRRTRRLAFGGGVLTLLLLMLFITPLGTAITGKFGGRPDIQHLAMLPLVTSAEEASVGEGLTVTLTSLLSRLGADAEEPITVVSASEVRDVESAAEARERFGVSVVVSGDFRQDGDQVHLVLNLVDTSSLRQLQSKQISESADRFAILERRAVASIAEMLGVTYSDERWDQLAAGGTTDAEAYELYLKGEAALQQADDVERIDTAIELFRWALQNDSLYALAHVGLGDAYRQKYDVTREPSWIDLAERHCARALGISERLVPARVTLGRLFTRAGDYNKAVGEFNLALALDMNQAAAHHELGEVYRRLGRASEAEVHYDKAIALQPRNWRYHRDLGAFYQDEGRYAEAIVAFQRVMELVPDNPQGYNNLGTVHLVQGQLIEARRLFERSVAIKPNYSAYTNLGAVYYAEDRPVEEAQMYEQALAINDSDFRVWSNLAGAYERSGASPERVHNAYQRAAQGAFDALTVNPNAASTRVRLAYYLIRAGRAVEARPHIERVLTSFPDDATVTYYVALSYELLGERELALEWIKKAVDNGYPIERLEQDTELDDLRKDPRFAQQLLALGKLISTLVNI